MNIAKLISPITLHNRKAKQKKQTKDNQNTQQLHTPISIPNELPYHQRLYFKQSEFFKSNTECESSNTEAEIPKFKKIDSTLNEIDKLKSQFAKRLKTQTYSEQKFISRSNQRHLLKPSAAPKIGIATSEFTVACFGNQKNQRNTIKEETFSFQVQARSPNEEQFIDDFQNNQPLMQQCNPSNESINCLGKNQSCCNCRTEFNSFIETMRAKMDNIALKVKAIEQKNAHFKKNSQKIHKTKINNDQNTIKIKKHKTEAAQRQNEPNPKHYYQKSSQFTNNQGSSSKINKGKMQTLLQRLQLRIQKQ